MENKRLTQQKIAELTGLCSKTIWTALKNPNEVKESTLKRIEDAFVDTLKISQKDAKDLIESYAYGGGSCHTPHLLPIDRWADEISRVCTKYSGEDWGFDFKAVDNGFEFKGFIQIPVKPNGSRGKYKENGDG